jgi:predicted TIM-barrel fold metal-dependent hydrolase
MAIPAKFPFFAGRVYTPELASPEEMTALHKALHIERVVIVTPSVYGTDNSATLFGMKARGATARGVAVIDDKTSESDLDAMGQAGFRGIRLNLATGGVNDPNVGRPRFQAAVERVKARGWHVQLYTNLPMISAIKDLVAASPVPVVFDHFGGAQAALGVEQPGFADLLELVKSGKAYVKISGAYRASKLAPDYPTRSRLPKALIAANADRIVWGTDWPHPDSVTPPGKASHRRDAAVPDRRRPAAQPAAGVGAGCRDPQEDPGRQSGAALRVLRSGLARPAREERDQHRQRHQDDQRRQHHAGDHHDRQRLLHLRADAGRQRRRQQADAGDDAGHQHRPQLQFAGADHRPDRGRSLRRSAGCTATG